MFDKIKGNAPWIAMGLLAFLAILFIVLIAIRELGKRAQTDTSQMQSVESLATPTLALTESGTPTWNTPTPVVDEGSWIFQGFTGEKVKIGKFEYEYGTFVSTGTKVAIKAMCSAPNSPSPKPGDIYTWDKLTNILVPVQDSTQGNKQRFWYPEYLK